MKYAPVLVAFLLCACSVFKSPMAPSPATAPAVAPAAATEAVQRVPFKIGVSSATVEALAKAQACTGAQGAGLVTAPGPVEVYRLQCDNGKVFMARCELRQCKAM